MRFHEMMGIEQNRRWGVCSLNDFRKVRRSLASGTQWNIAYSFLKNLGLKRRETMFDLDASVNISLDSICDLAI
jgi:hypothetical protein